MNVIALNYAQCIKQEAHWGYDKFHNICNGTWNTVHWGSMDWTSAIGMALFAGVVIAGITCIVGSMIAAERATAEMMKKFEVY